MYDPSPGGQQRGLKEAWADVSAPCQDAKYRGDFEQILATVRMMKARGIFMVPGTDMGGSFAYHRELELFQRAGYPAPEVLRLAPLGVADYLGQHEDLGTIADGQLADVFLVAADPTTALTALKAITMGVTN